MQVSKERGVASFVFDSRTQQYRHTSWPAAGKFISTYAVRNLLSQQIDLISSDARKIAELLIGGKISLSTWEGETAQALASLYHQSYMLGAGGERRVVAQDRVSLSGKIAEQLHFFRGLSQEIRGGAVSEAQLLTRLEQYIQASRGFYEVARESSHLKNGFFWERRRRTKTESCASCVGYAAQGWQPIGSLPPPGSQCECRSNCGCYKEFEKGIPRPDSLSFSSGWDWSCSYFFDFC